MQCVQKGLLQLKINLRQYEVGPGLVTLHLLIQQMKPRLQTILDMNDRRPAAVSDFQNKDCGSLPQDEMVGT